MYMEVWPEVDHLMSRRGLNLNPNRAAWVTTRTSEKLARFQARAS